MVGSDGQHCIRQVPTVLPRKISRESSLRRLHCPSCAAKCDAITPTLISPTENFSIAPPEDEKERAISSLSGEDGTACFLQRTFIENHVHQSSGLFCHLNVVNGWRHLRSCKNFQDREERKGSCEPESVRMYWELGDRVSVRTSQLHFANLKHASQLVGSAKCHLQILNKVVLVLRFGRLLSR